jgi:hypothetical protein
MSENNYTSSKDVETLEKSSFTYLHGQSSINIHDTKNSPMASNGYEIHSAKRMDSQYKMSPIGLVNIQDFNPKSKNPSKVRFPVN